MKFHSVTLRRRRKMCRVPFAGILISGMLIWGQISSKGSPMLQLSSQQERDIQGGAIYDHDCKPTPMAACTPTGADPGTAACATVGAVCGLPTWCPGGQINKNCFITWGWGFECTRVVPDPNCIQLQKVCDYNHTCSATSLTGAAGCGTFTDCSG